MDEPTRFVKIHSHWFLLAVFFLMFCIFAALHFFMSSTDYPKFSGFVGGLAAAFFVATLQFLIQFYEQIKLSKFRQHGVLDFLEERSDKKIYKKIISNAKKGTKIQLQGVTGSRFLQDFADADDTKSRELIDALDRGVCVEVLVAHSDFLEENNKPDLIYKTVVLAKALTTNYPDAFSIRYYRAPPSHNLLVCGDVCLVGPVFKGKTSKSSPAIIFDRSGSYVRSYIENFESVWAIAGGEHV